VLFLGPKIVNWRSKINILDVVDFGLMHLKVSNFSDSAMIRFFHKNEANETNSLSEEQFT
jgi:hypothetical protein